MYFQLRTAYNCTISTQFERSYKWAWSRSWQNKAKHMCHTKSMTKAYFTNLCLYLLMRMNEHWIVNATLIHVLILYLYSQAMCKKQQGWNFLVSQGNGTVLLINYSSTKNHLHRLKGCLSSTREYFSLKKDANSEN